MTTGKALGNSAAPQGVRITSEFARTFSFIFNSRQREFPPFKDFLPIQDSNNKERQGGTPLVVPLKISVVHLNSEKFVTICGGLCLFPKPWVARKAIRLVSKLVGLGTIGPWNRVAIPPFITLNHSTAAISAVRRIRGVMHINLHHPFTADIAPVRGTISGTINPVLVVGISHIICAIGHNATGVVRGFNLTILPQKLRNPVSVHPARAGVVTNSHLATGPFVLTGAWGTFINIGVTIVVIDPPIGTFAAIIPLPAGLGRARTHRVGRP